MVYINGDNFDPTALSHILQITPSEIGIKNDLKPNKRSVYTESFWKYCKESNFYSVDEAVTALLRSIESKSHTLRTFVADHTLEMAIICNVTIYEDRPVYELGRGTIQKLANLNAEFIMDIFDYSD
jgi:hypothetical protein